MTLAAALLAGDLDGAAAAAAILRAAHYAGSLGGAGLAFFALLFGARPEAAGDAARLRGWTVGAALLGLLAGPGHLAAQVWALTGGGTLADAEVWGVVLLARAGASHALGAAGLLLLVTAVTAGGARTGPAVAAAGGVLVCASYALAGHAAEGDPWSLPAGLVLLHLLAVAFWIGSLPPLAWAARREGPAAARLVRDWARLAVFAVPALAAAGLLLAALVGGGPAGLLDSRYGAALAVKLALVSALLGLAAWHRFRSTPALAAGVPGAGRRLARSVAVEAVVAVLVLYATARLVSIPPP